MSDFDEVVHRCVASKNSEKCLSILQILEMDEIKYGSRKDSPHRKMLNALLGNSEVSQSLYL